MDGNLYGRRAAGSVERNELEEILVSRLDPDTFQFARGQKIILTYHIDDFRAAGPEGLLSKLFEKEFAKRCEVQCGELERIGASVEVLGRKRIRAKD